MAPCENRQMELAAVFENIVTGRRSVRGFQKEPVPRDVLEKVFTLAAHAPSNCNTQPWQTVVVSGKTCERLRRKYTAALERGDIVKDFPFDGKYEGIFKARQYDAAFRLYDAMGIARDDKAGRAAAFMRNFSFFGAPHAAFIFMPDWGEVREAADVGMYAQTLMLAMQAHGIASCPQTALGFNADLVRQELGVAPAFKLLFGISFGYADPNRKANRCRVGRAPLAQTTAFLY